MPMIFSLNYINKLNLLFTIICSREDRMESREGAKKAVLFAKKIWRQTRPKTVEARRVKDEKIMKFGFPPFVLKAKVRVKFVVCAEYSDTLTIYHFSNAGEPLGAKTFEQPFEIKSEITKKSKLIYKFPRKRPSRA